MRCICALNAGKRVAKARKDVLVGYPQVCHHAIGIQVANLEALEQAGEARSPLCVSNDRL